MQRDELAAALKVYAGDSKEFTRRMAIDMADFYGVSAKYLICRLEFFGLLKNGSWDWFAANGGITMEHITTARADRAKQKGGGR